MGSISEMSALYVVFVCFDTEYYTFFLNANAHCG